MPRDTVETIPDKWLAGCQRNGHTVEECVEIWNEQRSLEKQHRGEKARALRAAQAAREAAGNVRTPKQGGEK